jgi:hypothetical protein
VTEPDPLLEELLERSAEEGELKVEAWEVNERWISLSRMGCVIGGLWFVSILNMWCGEVDVEVVFCTGGGVCV